VPTDPEKAAIDEAANALQIAVLLAARIATDQEELRRALTRAARSLATCAPTLDDR
jgi:hypothetical protein